MLLAASRFVAARHHPRASVAVATATAAARSYATRRSTPTPTPPPSSATPKPSPTPASSTSSPPPPASSPVAEKTTTTSPAAPDAAQPTNLGDIPTGSATPADPLTPPSPSSPAATASSPTPEDAAVSRHTSLAEHFLDISDVAPPSASGQTTGAKAKGSGSSTIERKRKNLTRGGLAVGVGCLLFAAYDLGKDWESPEERKNLIARSEDILASEQAIKDGWEGWLGRVKLRGADRLDYLNKPAWDPLLPAPLPEPHYRPYTLVIDLDDMLVHSNWDIDHGWRTAKRPGLDYFLAYMSQFYEIVLFTTQPGYTAAPIVEKIDPYGAYIPWKLFRESTRYKNNTLIKDLTYLGRPLERTIILDTNASHFQLQPDNGIALQPWTGTRGDATSRELVSLIPFLEALAIKGVKDVRPVIKHYEGKHIPTAYAEAEAKTKKALLDKWEEDRKNQGAVGGWFSAALGSLVKSPSGDKPPETDVEKVRKNAQRMYLEEQKYWKDNEEMIQKQMAEDREKQLKEMKGSLLSMMGLQPPPPPTQ